ncbi:PREDICTED: zinc metalloproteinase nas-14-like [Papilio xuthus]|uniref:Metalloendopeptidase n=1 Tax=Papilio xuthus TaxID=66420 RepID=A0AAJ6ZXM3_PAPXU|nr:PREDICTED: zinc metalloproteinase nas-14-like [Papilio xuthus]
MRRRLSQKCFIFIWLLFICLIMKYQNLTNASRYSYLYDTYARSSFRKSNLPSRRDMRVIRDNTNLPSGLEDAEPGFDLTEDEMRKFKIWPQGNIPYYIDDFSFDKVLRDRIRNYLDLTNRVTGLRFMELPKPPTDEKTRWVLFVNRQGLLNCADHSIKDFTNEGVQKVILGYDCLVTGGELAEAILALAGVPPQHNAPDRNEYITVNHENILPEKYHLFKAVEDNEWLFHDIPYDYSSAGHYSFHKYTKNGFATVELKKQINILPGESKGFSYNDIWKIRMLYNYNSRRKAYSIKASDCIKLFEFGANFSNYEPMVEDTIEPRKKPNKYLGLAEDKPIEENTFDDKEPEANKDLDTDDSKDENEGEKPKPDDVDDEKDNKTVNGTKKKLIKENTIKKYLNKVNEESNEEEGNQQNQIIQLKHVLKKSSDPFRDISDFESWETTRTLQRIFTKMKG